MAMIEVKNLTKRYRDRVAIDALNFEVPEGEILGFLGPNGAGKSTTMKILTGFIPPSEGSAKVAGFDIFDHPLEVKRRIGYLPETPPLYPEMSVRGYLAFVGRGTTTVILAAVLVALLLLITFDLDRPVRGIITVPDAVLRDVRQDMSQPAAAAAPTPP